MAPEKQSYRIDELATRWDCHEATVRRLIQTGQLDAFRLSRSWRVRAAEVRRFETNQPSTAVPPEQSSFEF